MKVLLQYWRQPKNKKLLISVSVDRAGLREARHLLLFADEGVVPEGRVIEATLEDYSPAATRLKDSAFVFLSDVELMLYVRLLKPT